MKPAFHKPRRTRNSHKDLEVSSSADVEEQSPDTANIELETVYHLEPELQTPVRRAVWTSQARGMRKVIRYLLLATLLIGGYKAYSDLYALNALLRQGQVTAAQVIDKYESHSKGTSYWIRYRFNGGREWVEDFDEVSQSFYASTRKGDTVRVTYLPSDPSIHRRRSVDAARVTSRERSWAIGIGLVAGVFVLMKAALEYSYHKQRRLAVSGVPVIGKITACKPPAKTTSSLYEIRYTFADLRGSTKTSTWNASEAQGKQLQPGEDVTVLCDPGNANNCCLYRALEAVQIEGVTNTASPA